MNDDYIPGDGCECSARCHCECACDADWTPIEFYELKATISDMETRHAAVMLHLQSIVDELKELKEQRNRLIEERDLEWFQIIESFANFHPVSMTDALEQGIKRCKAQKEMVFNLKRQRDNYEEALKSIAEGSDCRVCYGGDAMWIAESALAAVKGGDS